MRYEYDAADRLLSIAFTYTPSVRDLAIEKPERMRLLLLSLVASLTEFSQVRAVQLDFGGQVRLGLGQCSDLLRTPQPRPSLLNDERLLACEHGIVYLVDASQTVGAIPIDVQETEVDLLAFSGHKGLLGPTGTGALYIRDGITLVPLVRGGTGSDSAHDIQPAFLPDVFESGTLNVAGIAGLAPACAFFRKSASRR